MRTHLIHYLARTATGTEQGIARVLSDRQRPSWRDCAEHIPGFVTGLAYLGLEPQYTLKYATAHGPKEKLLGSSGVQRVGTVVMRLADRDQVWDIEVFDENGNDVTFNFACFAA